MTASAPLERRGNVRRAMDPAVGPSFATLLKRYRSASHLTQEVLAERAGLSREAISALERGERQYPRADTVGLLVRALGLGEAEHTALLLAAQPHLKARGAAPRQVAASGGWPTDVTSERPPSSGTPAWLPVPPTPLLGRRRELAKSCALLVQGGVRLLTLTGPGGVGKSRLALEVGANCRRHFADGVAFVPLASLRAPSLLADTLAHAVGAVEQEIGAPRTSSSSTCAIVKCCWYSTISSISSPPRPSWLKFCPRVPGWRSWLRAGAPCTFAVNGCCRLRR